MTFPRELKRALEVLRAEADRDVRWKLLAALIAAGAGALLAGLAPLALKGMVDTLSSARDSHHQAATQTGAAFGAAYLGALCGSRFLAEWRPALAGAAEQRLYARLRRSFFGHLLKLPLAFHLARPTGAIVQSIQQATTGYQILVSHLLNSVLPVGVELVTVTLVIVSLGQAALAAAFVATAIAYLALLVVCMFEFREPAHAVSTASLGVQASLTEGLLNCEAIKCLGAEQRAQDAFARATTELEAHWANLQRKRARMGGSLALVFTASMAASLAIAVHEVLSGALSIGGFVLANVCVLQLMRPLELLASAARDLSQALQFIRPLLDILDQPAEALSPRNLPRSSISTGAAFVNAPLQRTPDISFRAVHFAYVTGSPILRGLTFDVPACGTIAIVGASGSGKSSIARLLLRLYLPQAGSVLLDTVPIGEIPIDKLRATIGAVPQDPVLFNDSIAFNIGIGRAGSDRNDIERAAGLARLHDFVATLPAGYETVVGERGLRVSGGERQRIAIARAILRNPRVYILDEATSMLDSVTELAILHNLREVSAGCTTILIAHRLSTVCAADRILVLDHGTVVEQGTHENLLMRRGLYAKMWCTQRRQEHPYSR